MSVDPWSAAAILAIILGVGFRLHGLLGGRSLWLDESMLAVNILGRDFLGLLHPLDYDQAAAPLFLWGVKCIAILAGTGEIALRSLPFVAGVAILPATWLLGRSMFGREVGALAAALVSLSPGLIYYSVELKPYSVDAFVAVCLMILARSWGTVPTPPRTLGILSAGLLVIVLSLTAPFVLAPVGIAAFAWALSRRDRGGARDAVLVSAVWAGAFLVLYTVLIRHGENSYLQEFWAGDFLGASPSLRESGWRLVHALTFPLLLPRDSGGAAWLALGFGVSMVMASVRFGWQGVLLLAGPAAVLVIASLLSLYPVDGRLVLFLAPFTILLVSAGLAALLERLSPSPVVRAWLGFGAVAGGVAWIGPPIGRGPGMQEGGSEAVRLVVKRPMGDGAYILPGGGPKWVYYSTNWRGQNPARQRWYATQLTFGGNAFRNSSTVQGLAEADSLPLVAPGGDAEFLAFSAGARTPDRAAHGRTWADAEAGRLRRAAIARVWMYAGTYHDRDLPLLLPAFSRAGIVSTPVLQTRGEAVYLLKFFPQAETDSMRSQ